jgi:hypothetical protein
MSAAPKAMTPAALACKLDPRESAGPDGVVVGAGVLVPLVEREVVVVRLAWPV